MIGEAMKAGFFAQYPTVDSAMHLDLGLVTSAYCAAETSKAWLGLFPTEVNKDCQGKDQKG